MKHLLIGITAAMSIVVAGQVWAQAPAPGTQPAQWATAAPYPFNSTTPRDAYREGLLNRWEYEQFVGPEPQALQGPPVDGERGNDGGGRD